jgi:hypothetical protein
MKNIFLSTLLIVGMIGCNSAEKTRFTRLSSDDTGVDFQNKLVEDEQHNLFDYHLVYNGAGVAIGDLNNDNLPDLYFAGNQSGDKIYVNKGNLTFEDITEKAGIRPEGWSVGVTMVDINADGFLDIYVCKSGNYEGKLRANQLYINQGNSKGSSLRFKESAAQYGLADTSYTTQAAFFDYDKDGDLDAYLLTTTGLVQNPNKIEPAIKDGSGFSPDKLYRNNGNGTFTDVSRQAGILHDGLGLGVAIADFNDDGWEDILVSNDFLNNDYLYINTGNTRDGGPAFQESSKAYFKHQSRFSMGNDVADINNDGRLDVMTLDMLPADNFQRKKMTARAISSNLNWSFGRVTNRSLCAICYMSTSAKRPLVRYFSPKSVSLRGFTPPTGVGRPCLPIWTMMAGKIYSSPMVTSATLRTWIS